MIMMINIIEHLLSAKHYFRHFMALIKSSWQLSHPNTVITITISILQMRKIRYTDIK